MASTPWKLPNRGAEEATRCRRLRRARRRSFLRWSSSIAFLPGVRGDGLRHARERLSKCSHVPLEYALADCVYALAVIADGLRRLGDLPERDELDGLAALLVLGQHVPAPAARRGPRTLSARLYGDVRRDPEGSVRCRMATTAVTAFSTRTTASMRAPLGPRSSPV